MRFLFLLFALPVPVLAQTPTTTPTPTVSFDWKVRLSQGQKWTQSAQVSTDEQVNGAKFSTSTNFVWRNEVLFANDKEYVINSTFTQFKQISHINFDGVEQYQPDRSKFTRAFVGVPFKIKLSTEGKVVAVSGLEKLRKSGEQSIAALAQSSAERAQLLHSLPPTDQLKDVIVIYQELTLPSHPLAIGSTYSHIFETYPTFLDGKKIPVKRTLLSFDQSEARFGEAGALSTFTDHPELRPLAKGERAAFEAFSGKVSGQTTVQVTTGLVQSHLDFRGNAKTTVIEGNGEKFTSLTKRQIQVNIATNLDP